MTRAKCGTRDDSATHTVSLAQNCVFRLLTIGQTRKSSRGKRSSMEESCPEKSHN